MSKRSHTNYEIVDKKHYMRKKAKAQNKSHPM